MLGSKSKWICEKSINIWKKKTKKTASTAVLPQLLMQLAILLSFLKVFQDGSLPPRVLELFLLVAWMLKIRGSWFSDHHPKLRHIMWSDRSTYSTGYDLLTIIAILVPHSLDKSWWKSQILGKDSAVLGFVDFLFFLISPVEGSWALWDCNTW